jgi:uncharacterized protein (TIGR03083 family)
MTTDRKVLWKEKITQARTDLINLLKTLSPAQWRTRVFSEQQEWTVQDIVAHLTDGEQGMSIQVHKIRKGQETIPEGFNLDQWNAGLKERVGTMTVEELLDRLEKIRARTLQGLESLNENEWELTGRHPSRGIITIEQYYETLAIHDQIHTQDIRRALGL